MPLHPPFFVKAFKKPFILAFMVAIILLGAYMAQSYVWNVNYLIDRLTESEVVLDLCERTGVDSFTGTMRIPDVMGSEDEPDTQIWAGGRSLHIYVLVSHENLDELEKHFYSLTIRIHIRYSLDGGLSYDSGKLKLVSEGSHCEVSVEENSGLEGIWYRFPDGYPLSLPPITGTWDVWFDIMDIQVGAVEETTEGAILIYVYAIEV